MTAPPLSTVTSGSRFRLVRKGDERSEDGLWLGYTFEELADRLHELFRSVGVQDGWPDLVVLFGHGSSSVNNPYFAAYNCGACSGRAGAPNARAFAKAANRPEVRAALRTRGLDIPESTWFMGALFDTTRDQATYYDLERMPECLREAFQRLRASDRRSLRAQRRRAVPALRDGAARHRPGAGDRRGAAALDLALRAAARI